MDEYSSLHLYNELRRLDDNETKRLLDGLLWVNQNIPSAILIGGTAIVNFLPNRTLTPDFDFMVKDIESVKETLYEHGLTYSKLSNEIGITVEKFNVDIINSQKGITQLNNLILKDFAEGIINGLNAKIVKPELLCILKLELGRDQDLIDAFLLLNSKVMYRFTFEKYVLQLKDHLNDYESMILYGDLIELE